MAERVVEASLTYLHNFDIAGFAFLAAHELPFQETDDVFVLRGCRYITDGVGCDAEPQPFEPFLARLPARETARHDGTREPGRTRVPQDVRDRWIAEYPWLAQFQHGLRKAAGRLERCSKKPRLLVKAAVDEAEGDVSSDGSDDVDVAVHVVEPVPEHDAPALGVEEEAPVLPLDALEILAAKRAELSWDDSEQLFFYTQVRSWADCVSGYPRGGRPLEWCRKYLFRKMFSNSISKYGDNAAMQLSREYCRRGEWYYMIWLETGSSADFRYTQEHLDSYLEIEEWVDWLLSLVPGSLPYARGMEIKRAVPINPK